MKIKHWLWVVGTALLLHIILIALTFIEVFIYSILFEPGHDQAFYEAHAEKSGPWIATIFGFIIIFFLVRRYTRNNPQTAFTYALAMPGVYVLFDLVLLPFTGPDWTSGLGIVLLSNAIKMSAGYLAWSRYRVTQP